MRKPFFDFAALQARLVFHAESIARRLLPNGKRTGHDWIVGNTNGDKGGSLAVCLRGGPCPGIWKDFATEEKGDLIDLWARVRKISNYEAAAELTKQYLNGDVPQPVANPAGRIALRKEVIPMPNPKDDEDLKPINAESLRNLQRRLAANAEAMAYLRGEKRGIDDDTIAHFGLGLSFPYMDQKTGLIKADALTAPMRSPETGLLLKKLAYTPIPGVTQNPTAENTWMAGHLRTYWADKVEGQLFLFICEGLKDTWRVWQELAKTGKIGEWALITASHGVQGIPDEWKDENFWRRWQGRIYLGQDNDTAGNKVIPRLLSYIGGAARRVLVPEKYGKDWTDFFQHGATIDEFFTLVQDARLAGPEVDSGEKVEARESGTVAVPSRVIPKPGIYSYKPVDISGAYTNGHLYYTVQRHIVQKNPQTDQVYEGLETVVVRSDGQLLSTQVPPTIPGMKLTPVLKLTDGTLIEKEPKASPYATWEWNSIAAYIKGESKTRPLLTIVKEIVVLLKQTIWLPNEEDYYALALVVPVTYTQAIFDAVPSIHANGPWGSGKTQLGNALAKLCMNGSVVGQVSAAAAARHIDETRGFVVIDDIEAIAAKTGKDGTFNEFVQFLKQGYNRHSAVKVWTDVKAGMKNEKLNFFGVKFLSNTLGSDFILGSRLIRIQTLAIPEGTPTDFRDFSIEEQDHLRELRNELHTWTFMNTSKVNDVYHSVHAGRTDRQTEIAAPLRTMAQICGDPEIAAQLEACLARQQVQQESFNDNPVKALKVAVRNLIRQGFDTVTLAHVGLELSLLLEANYGKSSTTEIAEWERPSWISSQLRSNGLIEDTDVGRKRIFGKHLRLFKFTSRILLKERVDESGNPLSVINRKEPEAFCRGCQGCQYKDAGCEYMPVRMAEMNQYQRVN